MPAIQTLIPSPNRPQGKAGLEKLIRTIPVRDANGTRLTLFEFQQVDRRRIIFGLHFTSKRAADAARYRRSGHYVNENTFKLATGEVLRRIKPEP